MDATQSATHSSPRATIVLQCRDTLSGHSWEEEGARINLDSSHERLAQEVAAAAVTVRRKMNKKLLIIKEQGMGITMRATQTFGSKDSRTLYLNSFPRRFCSVRDMFSTKELADAASVDHDMALYIDLEIGPVELRTGSSPLSTEKPDPTWLYHRIGTIPIPGERYTPQGTYAVLYRIDPDQRLPLRILCVPKREHNGVVIGDVTRSARIDPLPLKKSQQSQLYRGMSKAERDQTLANYLEMVVATRYQEDGVPQLPHMTYNHFEPAPSAKTISTDDPITLDVRLYSKLHTIGGGDIAVPNSILMEAYAQKGAKSTIVEEIAQTIFDKVDALDEGKEWNDGSRAALLFGPGLEGKWAMELWIMPQSGKMEKLYRYREESLVWFLDREMAEQGKRILYVEAHLVPK